MEPSSTTGPEIQNPVPQVTGYTITPHDRHWELRDPAGELVCLTVYRRGAEEVIRRLCPSGPVNGGAYDQLLVRLKAPLALQDFGESLDDVEREIRGGGFWDRERSSRFEDSCMAVLLTRMRFYLFALTSQQLIINDLRQQLGQEAPVH